MKRDVSFTLRKTLPEPVLKNESIIREQEMRKTEEISLFRQFRELVLEHRQQELIARNQLKQNVLEMYEDLQVSPYRFPKCIWWLPSLKHGYQLYVGYLILTSWYLAPQFPKYSISLPCLS